ncbi:MAG: hypothetical protein NC923_00935 [Candidatus Omnitrophica bacterium]|nr:hypothetical protein [Candidatus Omnitrophota bacterium]
MFKAYLFEYKADILREIFKRAKENKDFFSDSRGWPYIQEVDGYRWMRRIENYLATGQFGALGSDGREYDNLMNAPLGREIEPLKAHYYIGFIGIN